MSVRMRKNGLRMARDERVATAACNDCSWTERTVGDESRSYSTAKHHASVSGHTTTVRYERLVEYAQSGS